MRRNKIKRVKEKNGVFKMTPLKNSFKSLLLKRIPALTREELDRYDNVFALTQELRLHASVTPWRENKKIIEKRNSTFPLRIRLMKFENLIFSHYYFYRHF